MIAPFEASMLKLERAANHLQELNNATAKYLARKPCVIVVEQFPGMELDFATQAWTARIREPVPHTLSPIIGDVVHNLRAALDLMACDLVRLNGKSPKSVHFPFAENSMGLVKMIREKNFHKAGVDAVQLLESLKPYKGGNIALRSLHDMDLADKHQALLPMLSAVSLPIAKMLGLGKDHQLQSFTTLIAKDGQIVIGVPSTLSVQLGTEIPARFFLAFGDGPGFGNREILQFLHHLAKETNGIVQAFTSLRPGAKFPIASDGSRP